MVSNASCVLLKLTMGNRKVREFAEVQTVEVGGFVGTERKKRHDGVLKFGD